MYAVDVILDWLTEHSDGFCPPGPALEDHLCALAERGAPEALIALYRRVGQGAVGLLPCGSFDGLYPLLGPTDVLRLLERGALHPSLDGGWPFAGDGEGWLVLQGGAVYHLAASGPPQRVASSAEELLFRHLEGLLEGRYAWNPGRQRFVPSRDLPLTTLAAALAGRVEIALLDKLTEEILSDLSAGLPVEIAGVGKLVITHHAQSRRIDASTGRVHRRPARQIARLRSDRYGALTRRINGEPPIEILRPIAMRSVPLDQHEGLALAEAIVEAIAGPLLAGRSIAWSGLGEFVPARQPAYTTRERDGTASLVPQRAVAAFIPYAAVERALMPRE